MSLNEILAASQGGKAVDNLAAQFGLPPDQAQAAVQAMIPAFSAALTTLAAHPAAVGALLTEMASGAHASSYAGGAPDAGAAGSQALPRIFGSDEAIGQVVDHVAQASGVDREAVARLLPAVASILIGGLAKSMTDQGHSGALGDLAAAAAAPGGLAAVLQSAQGESGGGLTSLLSSIFGGPPAPAPPQTAALVAGLATLGAMFASGMQASQAQQASLNAVAQSFVQPPPM